MRFVQLRSVNAAGNGSWSGVLAKQLITIPAGNSRTVGLPFTATGNQTIAGIFGSANEAGLASGNTSESSTNILLLDENGQTSTAVFFNSAAGQWREGPTDMGATAIPQGSGFILWNPTGADDHIVLAGTPRASDGPPVSVAITTQTGKFQLVTHGRTTATRLVDLNLNPGPGAGQFKIANLSRNADRIWIRDAEGNLVRHHHNGTNWMSGDATTNDTTIPPGAAFFILRATGSTFETWVLPAEAP
jgi:hypothetical protein